MRFTQFMFPAGKKIPVIVDVPEDVERKAQELNDDGWKFEIECDPNMGLVHMDCCNYEGVLSNRICQNGPKVPQTVIDLVNEAYARNQKIGRPVAA